MGKAICAMAFRKPTMAYLEEVFVDIGKAQKGRITLSKRTVDEILTVIALLPMMSMNLRAEFDQEVTITDASPTGGGGAVATEFKVPPDFTIHNGERCFHQCGERLDEERVYPCPEGCGVGLCSLHCIEDHRNGECRRKTYVVPKFGERRAPLSRAVARGGGIEVQAPYDHSRGQDFSSEEGKAALSELAAEHWGPECRLFSRARGRPVRLENGSYIRASASAGCITSWASTIWLSEV